MADAAAVPRERHMLVLAGAGGAGKDQVCETVGPSMGVHPSLGRIVEPDKVVVDSDDVKEPASAEAAGAGGAARPTWY